MLNSKLKEALAQLGTQKTLKSHTTLIRFSEVANKSFLVLKGGVVSLHVNPNTGAERAINFFIPQFHPIATVAESLYLNKPSEYHLKTFTTTTLVEIKKTDLENFLNSSEFGQEFHHYGIQTLLEKNSLRALLISLSSSEMLQHLHSNHPQIMQHVPSKYIADFLGISPQWLSKLKHNL